MFLILKAWLAKRPIAWVVILFVAFAVFVNIVVFSVTEGMIRGFLKQIESQFPALVVVHYDNEGRLSSRWEERDYSSALSQVGLLQDSVFELETQGLLRVPVSDGAQGVKIRGLTKQGLPGVLSASSLAQEDVQLAFSDDEVCPLIISQDLADRLGLEIGQSVEIWGLVPSSPTRFISRPKMRSLKARVAQVSNFQSIEDNNSLFLPLKIMQKFMNLYGDYAEISRAYLQASKFESIDISKINRELLNYRSEAGFYHIRRPLRSQTWIQQIYNEMNMVRIVGAFVILLASCAVFLMIHLLMISKIKTFGLLMAMGVSRKRIFRIVVIYGLLLSVCGSLIGWGAGYFFMKEIVAIHNWLIVDLLGLSNGLFGIYGFDSFPSAYSHKLAFFLTLVSCFFCTLAALVPAWRSSRLQPAEVLKNE